MWKVGPAFAAGIMATVFASQAQATPTCGPAGTLPGDTITVTGGQSLPVSTLLTTGTCVNAGDNTFGDFADTGFSNTGSVSWVFASDTSNVTIGFLGALGPSTTGTLSYQVAINPAITTTRLIDDVEKDFTLNAMDGTGFAIGALTGTSTSPAFDISCTRTDNPEASSCPANAKFAGVTSLTFDQTLTLGANSVATALTDTISQISTIPEPATLTVLGGALLGFGAIRRRRR